MYYLVKILISAGLIVLVSEASKRSALMAGLLASLPLVSFLGMIWLFVDTGDTQKVADLSRSIFWLVLPSLPFFLLLPYLLGRNWGFYPSLAVSTVVMIALYYAMTLLLKRYGVEV
ncbi:DUF3147 family protein [Blastopirellula marina]|uniref:DUF3147 domain-containing protein n=1 Tax=Blastopirellula marina TaxID=124 RepID=A0A2S8GS22_9BACT|nr:DUF3147 family protein [Blastopirellula marina]PQO47220.1 hypothetical protein C5Y93_04050 [Blastopirellula marina]